MKLVSIREAKEQGLARYYTGRPCKRGHVGERITGNAACVECERARLADHYAKNTHEIRARTLAWQKANPDMANAKNARRRARKLQRTPGWADHKEIAAQYAMARKMTDATGRLHVVDHIIPLQGKKVCGLHWHENLRVIPAPENLTKSARLDHELAELYYLAEQLEHDGGAHEQEDL